MTKLINLSDSFFIAGGSGMVGKAIYKVLSKKGYGKEENGGEILKPSSSELDLTNHSSLEKWFKKNKPSVVIMAAAKVGGILANYQFPYEFLLENLKIQSNIIELSKIYGVKRLLFLGSSCIYPKFASQPIKEEELLTKKLESTNEYYALAKISGIKLCEALRKQYNFDAICLMPTNLYGPNDNYHPTNSHVIPGLIKRFHDAKEKKQKFVTCWGSGAPLREFLYVEDLAEACLFALENWNPTTKNKVEKHKFEELCWINVGSSSEVTIKDLAKLISQSIGYEGEINWDISKPDGTPRKKLDTSRFKNLGWTAETNLKTGIKKTIEAFKTEKLLK